MSDIRSENALLAHEPEGAKPRMAALAKAEPGSAENSCLVLLSAYACEPGKGSEPEVGWSWLKAHLAMGWKARVVTRANNCDAILAACPEAEVIAHEPPAYWLGLKHRYGGLGQRFYYLLWQASLAKRIAALAADAGLVHHATIVNAWTPAAPGMAGLPFVWGPVGGGDDPPWRLLAGLGPLGMAKELGRMSLRRLMTWLPATRRTARNSMLALATTPASERLLRRLGARQVGMLSQVALSPADLALLTGIPISAGPGADKPLRLVAIGELLRRKGLHLVFAGLAQLPPDLAWSLDIVGRGPEARLLQRLAAAHGLADRVRFVGPLKRAKLMFFLHQYHVLLHLSLRDSGGMVCAEAMAAGLAVVCLDLGGPAVITPEQAGIRLPARNAAQIAADLAAAIRHLSDQPQRLQAMRQAARAHAIANLSWEARQNRYLALLRGAGVLS